jgi:hypothetical protein
MEDALTPQDQAIRAQLVIAEQVDLFDYWRAKCTDTRFPLRADIQPSEIRSLLPSISILEVIGEEDLQLRVRLAGTRLRDYLGVETTGKVIADFNLGEQRDYWAAAYKAANLSVLVALAADERAGPHRDGAWPRCLPSV